MNENTQFTKNIYIYIYIYIGCFGNQVQFRKNLKRNHMIKKKKAHRSHIESKKRQKLARQEKKIEKPLHELEIFPLGADVGDDNHCRVCGQGYNEGIECQGCSCMVCRKCSDLKIREWNRVKKQSIKWICRACSFYLYSQVEN